LPGSVLGLAVYALLTAGARPEPPDLSRLASEAVLDSVSAPNTSIRAQAVVPLADDVLVVACTETGGAGVEGRVDQVVGVRMRRDGRVVTHRAAPSSLAPTVGGCVEVGVRGGPRNERRWPIVDVRYRSEHRVDGSTVLIDWISTLDFESMTALRRVPTRLVSKRPDGSGHLELFSTRIVGKMIELRARIAGRAEMLPCDDACVIEPAAVLGLAGE
jgi:hypothetical protein